MIFYCDGNEPVTFIGRRKSSEEKYSIKSIVHKGCPIGKIVYPLESIIRKLSSETSRRPPITVVHSLDYLEEPLKINIREYNKVRIEEIQRNLSRIPAPISLDKVFDTLLGLEFEILEEGIIKGRSTTSCQYPTRNVCASAIYVGKPALDPNKSVYCAWSFRGNLNKSRVGQGILLVRYLGETLTSNPSAGKIQVYSHIVPLRIKKKD